MLSIILIREQLQNPGRKKIQKRKHKKKVGSVYNFKTKLCNQYRMITQSLSFKGKVTQA